MIIEVSSATNQATVLWSHHLPPWKRGKEKKKINILFIHFSFLNYHQHASTLSNFQKKQANFGRYHRFSVTGLHLPVLKTPEWRSWDTKQIPNEPATELQMYHWSNNSLPSYESLLKTPQLLKLSALWYLFEWYPGWLLNLVKQTRITDYTISCLLWSAAYR